MWYFSCAWRVQGLVWHLPPAAPPITCVLCKGIYISTCYFLKKEEMLFIRVHLSISRTILWGEQLSMSFPPKQEGQLPHVYAIKLYFLCGFAFFFSFNTDICTLSYKTASNYTSLKSFLVGKYCKIFVCNYHVFTGPRVSDFQWLLQ